MKSVLDATEKILLEKYTMGRAIKVVAALEKALHNLNYMSHGRSIAILASISVCKVLYLTFDVHEAILVDEPFTLPDILHYKQVRKEYLLLHIEQTKAMLYKGAHAGLELIKSNELLESAGVVLSNGEPENAFLKQVDLGLSILLSVMPYPVFVIGVPEVIAVYKKINANRENIMDYIPVANEEMKEQNLSELVRSHLTNWQIVKQKIISNRIQEARTEGLLICDEEKILQAASAKNSLLIINKKQYYKRENAS